MRFIFSLSFIVLSIIGFMMIVNPLRADVKSLKLDVATYKEALDNSMNLQDLRDNLLASYRSIKQEDIERLNHMLPNTVSSIEVVLEIEKIANKYGVLIEDIKFESGKEDENGNIGSDNTEEGMILASNLPYGEFIINFNAEGSYESFNSFLSELESNLRIVDVESISFDTDKEENKNSNLLSYELKVKTYWLK